MIDDRFLNTLMYADDQITIANSENNLQRTVHFP